MSTGQGHFPDVYWGSRQQNEPLAWPDHDVRFVDRVRVEIRLKMEQLELTFAADGTVSLPEKVFILGQAIKSKGTWLLKGCQTSWNYYGHKNGCKSRSKAPVRVRNSRFVPIVPMFTKASTSDNKPCWKDRKERLEKWILSFSRRWYKTR